MKHEEHRRDRDQCRCGHEEKHTAEEHEQAMALAGYTAAPFNAWSGWRLRIPGGPIGGQYHGYIASDDIVDGVGWPAGHDETFRPTPSEELRALGGIPSQPWDSVWGGIPLDEGENVSDYVYRSTAELRPRPNASGGTNVVRGMQTRRSPGFSIAPGNYRGLGMMYETPIIEAGPWGAGPVPARTWFPPYFPRPIGRPVPPIRLAPPSNGATSVVNQPPPPSPTPAPAPSVSNPGYVDAAGNYTTDWHNPYVLYLPQSPRPAPTVAASPEDFLPAQGQPLDTSAPASPSIGDWFSQSSLISGLPNWGVLAGGAVGAFLVSRMMGRGR